MNVTIQNCLGNEIVHGNLEAYLFFNENELTKDYKINTDKILHCSIPLKVVYSVPSGKKYAEEFKRLGFEFDDDINMPILYIIEILYEHKDEKVEYIFKNSKEGYEAYYALN